MDIGDRFQELVQPGQILFLLSNVLYLRKTVGQFAEKNYLIAVYRNVCLIQDREDDWKR